MQAQAHNGSRRLALKGLALAFGSAALPATALAQAYPAKPIRAIQGFAVGGNADTIARVGSQPK